MSPPASRDDIENHPERNSGYPRGGVASRRAKLADSACDPAPDLVHPNDHHAGGEGAWWRSTVSVTDLGSVPGLTYWSTRTIEESRKLRLPGLLPCDNVGGFNGRGR